MRLPGTYGAGRGDSPGVGGGCENRGLEAQAAPPLPFGASLFLSKNKVHNQIPWSHSRQAPDTQGTPPGLQVAGAGVVSGSREGPADRDGGCRRRQEAPLSSEGELWDQTGAALGPGARGAGGGKGVPACLPGERTFSGHSRW